jgi:hypothetical protein
MASTNKAYHSARIEIMVENGRKEIKTKKQLEKYPIGSLISYMNNEGIFRYGGFITKFADDYFIYILPDFKTRYRARYSHIQKMWVGNVYSTKQDIVSIIPTDRPLTNFPVTVNDIIIYYAKKTIDAKRFMNTDKYKKIVAWVDYFE